MLSSSALFCCPSDPSLDSSPFSTLHVHPSGQATLQIVTAVMQQIFRAISSGISKQILTQKLGTVLVCPKRKILCNLTQKLTSNLGAAISNKLSFANPNFFLNPISLTLVDLHPVPFYGLNFASYVTFVVLWIGLLLYIRWRSVMFHISHDTSMTRCINDRLRSARCDASHPTEEV